MAQVQKGKKKMHLPERKAHIGGFEMHQCQKLIDLCRGNNETKEDVTII